MSLIYQTVELQDILNDFKSKFDQRPFEMTTHVCKPFTHCQYQKQTSCDFIFYEKNSFDLRRVIPVPPAEQLRANVAIPSRSCPSDHVAVVFELDHKKMNWKVFLFYGVNINLLRLATFQKVSLYLTISSNKMNPKFWSFWSLLESFSTGQSTWMWFKNKIKFKRPWLISKLSIIWSWTHETCWDLESLTMYLDRLSAPSPKGHWSNWLICSQI